MEYKWIFLALALAAIVYSTAGRSYVRQPVPRCPNVWVKRDAEIHRLREILEERKGKDKGKGKTDKPSKGSKDSKESHEGKGSKESNSEESSEFDTTAYYTTPTDDVTSEGTPFITSHSMIPTTTSPSATTFVLSNPCNGFCREYCLVTEREEVGKSCAPFTWCKCCV
ncbi:uncharacterized protein [Palaemon carinicauda]|uniref:uncharacterized protein n=1 Tax=Palaemon carinicauda TaxID=392227 RepID=UPI0035B60D4D